MDRQAEQLEQLAAADMFRKMNNVCFMKCVRRYDDGDVTVGEGACLERCVFKYLEAYKLVSDHMTDKQNRMQAQMQQMQ